LGEAFYVYYEALVGAVGDLFFGVEGGDLEFYPAVVDVDNFALTSVPTES
jgi:hypothetical protein